MSSDCVFRLEFEPQFLTENIFSDIILKNFQIPRARVETMYTCTEKLFCFLVPVQKQVIFWPCIRERKEYYCMLTSVRCFYMCLQCVKNLKCRLL